MLGERLFQHGIVQAASVTAIITGAGVLTGLGLDALILFRFGAGSQTDAFFAALVIPNLLIGLISIQGPKILVPIFSSLFDASEDEAWTLLRTLLTICGVLFAGVVLAGVVTAGVTMRLQVPGLDASTIAHTVRLSKLLFVLVLFQGLGSILQSVLYARQFYMVSSAPKLIVNSVTIAVILMFGANHAGVEAVAWGMIAGSVVQLVILGAVLVAQGFRYRWTLQVTDGRLRRIFASFRFPLLDHVLGESAVILQSMLASFLGSGSLTLLHYASRILGAIGGILLGSVVQVTLPLIARHAAANDLGLQRKTLLDSIQILSLAALPLSMWLAFTAESLVVLLFQRGQFSPADATTTAHIVQAMIVYFFLARFVGVAQTMFYVNGDFRTPLISTIIFTIANAGFALLLAPWLSETGLGIALSIAAVCNTLYMLLKLNASFGPLGWIKLWPFLVRLGSSSVLAGIAFAAGLTLASVIAVSETLSRLLAVAIPSVLGFSVFLAAVVVSDATSTRRIAAISNRLSP